MSKIVSKFQLSIIYRSRGSSPPPFPAKQRILGAIYIIVKICPEELLLKADPGEQFKTHVNTSDEVATKIWWNFLFQINIVNISIG